MITLYAVRNYSSEIKPCEFDRVTDKSAIRNTPRGTQRLALVNEYQSLHPTREAAVEAKRKQLKQTVEYYFNRLTAAEDELAKFESVEGK